MQATELAAKQRMLRLWQALSDAHGETPVAMVTTDQTVVRATSLLPNGSQSLFAVTQLETPLGTYPSAVVPTKDLVEIDAVLTHAQLRRLFSHEQ